ncbi:Sjoegren syndrome nuclear autoantigen 1 homolog isoform X1 [Agrilus planipennis]|uniref:Sjoegren syndrome nuclear autoantigen 1 homolog isoform X1 n=1 Tax=Agrilus planipennis TaxID=224129 RepID=A0A7F5R2X0_AGRPL|nr:Sjoegren syndrome nuclear autoantigen 1 homolog isoform X1 [Agrilus planipennis]
MSEHGAALQTYNQELVKCLEELKNKRNALQVIIEREENEKMQLEKNMKVIQDKLQSCNNKLIQHIRIRNNYDQTIKETEVGFKKILESSQTLLNLVQHEAGKLNTCIDSLCKISSIQYNASCD